MGPELMFMAFPIALAFAVAIYAMGRWLPRRIARAKAEVASGAERVKT